MCCSQSDLLSILRGSIAPSTGCTEPCAIALNTATARARVHGPVKLLELSIDEFLFKNAMGVGIPGMTRRGVPLCAAVGLTAGDATAGVNVLHTVSPAQAEEAARLVEEGRIAIHVLSDCSGLFIQSTLHTSEGCVRITTTDYHDNIADIAFPPCEPLLPGKACPGKSSAILGYTLPEMLDFIEAVPQDALDFLQDGIDMNLAVAEAGSTLDFGRAMKALLTRGALADCPITQAKLLTASASYARMCGLPVPVMTATGSGNQGITVTLTIEGVAKALSIPQGTKLRALALAHLVNLYSKAHIGNLSALCSCGVASGLGASAAVVYMLGGNAEQMLLAAQNMAGSICGMICDGAKEGCANKAELAAGTAVQSAYLAMENVGIPSGNGILSPRWETLFENLGTLSTDGMREANRVIVRIMQRESTCTE